MKDPLKEYTDHNKKHGTMPDYRDAEHRYKVAAGFIWIGLIGGLITLIITYLV